MRARWWDWQGFIQRQLALLRDAGVQAELDSEQWANGRAVIRFETEIEGKVVDLAATFPQLFPYTRFDISGTLDLRRHYDPIGKNLCVIGRLPENWSLDDSILDYVRDRIPRVFTAATTTDQEERRSLEETQGEPYSGYYPTRPNSIILLDGTWRIPSAIDKGSLELSAEPAYESFRGCVTRVLANKMVVATLDEAHIRSYPAEIPGRWVRLAEPPATANPLEVLEIVEGVDPLIVGFKPTRIQGLDVDVLGLLFDEETAVDRIGDGWIFVVRTVQASLPKRKQQIASFLVRAGRAGRDDLAERLPCFADLQRRSVLLVGAGALGAALALELTRAGLGRLNLLDSDHVEPGNSVRWPLGFSWSGVSKVDALRAFVRENYPYTQLDVYNWRLGASGSGPEELELIERASEGVDQILDCTADIHLQHYLSEFAKEIAVPYVCASATPGFWGGLVIRVANDKNKGCWTCARMWLMDDVPSFPLADPKGNVQPAGCGDITFTGANYDALHIVAAAAGVAVSELTTDEAQSTDWDIAVINLRDEKGRRIPPSYSCRYLDRHPQCPECAQRDAG